MDEEKEEEDMRGPKRLRRRRLPIRLHDSDGNDTDEESEPVPKRPTTSPHFSGSHSRSQEDRHTTTMRDFRDAIMNSFITVLSSDLQDAGKLIDFLHVLSKKHPYLSATFTKVPGFGFARIPDSTSSEELFEFMRFWMHGLLSLLLTADDKLSQPILTYIFAVGELVSFGNPELMAKMFKDVCKAIKGENVCLRYKDKEVIVSYKFAEERRLHNFTQALEVFHPVAMYQSGIQKSHYLSSLLFVNSAEPFNFFTLFAPTTFALGRLLPAAEFNFLAMLNRIILRPAENSHHQERQLLLLLNHRDQFSLSFLCRLNNRLSFYLTDNVNLYDSDTEKLMCILYSLTRKELCKNGTWRVLLERQHAICQESFKRTTFSSFDNPLLEDTIRTELSDAFYERVDKLLKLQKGRNIIQDIEIDSCLWKAVSSKEWTSLLTNLNTIDADLPTLLTALKSSSSLIRLASRLNSKLMDETSEKSTGFIPVCEFLTVEIITKWAMLVLDVLIPLFQDCSTTSLEDTESIYCLILDTIKALDDGHFLNFDLPLQLSCKLTLMAGLPWLNNCQNELSQQHVGDMLPFFRSAIIERKVSFLAKGKCLLALSSALFLPWWRFILASFLTAMEDTSSGTHSTIQILSLIAEKNWIFRSLPWTHTLCYLQGLIQKREIWHRNPLLRRELAKAINQMPCLFSMCKKLLESDKTNNAFKKPGYATFNLFLSNCHVCCEGFVSGKRKQTNIIPIRELSCVLKLALPLMRSQFPGAQFNCCELLRVARNHNSSDYSKPFIQEFAAMAARSNVSVGKEAMKHFAHFFKRSSNILDNCRRLEGVIIFFQTLLGYKNSSTILLVILQEFVTSNIDEYLIVEVIKFCATVLARKNTSSDSVTRVSLVQKLCESLALYANPPCQAWELLTKLRYELAPTFVQLIKNQIMGVRNNDLDVQKEKVLCFLSCICEMGLFQSRKAFVRYIFPVMMGEIVPHIYKDVQFKNILHFLATWSSETQEQLIQSSFPTFFRIMALEHAPETLQNTLTRLTAKFPLLVPNGRHAAMNGLLIYLHEKADIVLKHLNLLDNLENGFKVSTNLSTSLQQKLLDKCFMGFTVCVDAMLNSRLECVDQKKKILSSFTCLLEKVGRELVEDNQAKVYATLNSIFSLGPEYMDLHFQAWKTFANCLGPTLESLDTTVSIFAAICNKLHPHLPSEVEDFIINYIRVHRQELTSSNSIVQLYFVQEYTNEEDIVQSITDAVTLLGPTWVDGCAFLVQQAGNENSHIRFHAIAKLLDILKNDHIFVKSHLMEKHHPLVGKIVSSFLLAAAGTDDKEAEDKKKTRLKLAEAIGYLGAFDPYRFGKQEYVENAVQQEQLAVTVNCSEFAIKYLPVLVREFQGTENTTSFDYCACLIQDLMRHYKVEATQEDSIWNCLSENERKLILPLLSSKYRVERTTPLILYPCPLYQSVHGKDYDSWISNWVLSMAYYFVQEEQEETITGKIFDLSKYMIARNSRIANFLLPYIATHSIVSNYGDVIITEIQTICQLWIDQEKMKSYPRVMNKKDTEAMSFDEHFNNKVCLPDDANLLDQQRCTGQLFSLLDHLYGVARKSKAQIGLNKLLQGSTTQVYPTHFLNEEDTEKLSGVLEQIQLQVLSRVAFYTRDFTRSLFYWEQIVDPPELTEESFNFLQQLYISLGDTDSVVGLSKHSEQQQQQRQRKKMLNEVVCESFARGKIDTTGIRHLELMVNKDPQDLFATKALMEAYLQLDEPRKAETLFEGAIKRNATWEIQLEDYQIKAALKLGEWNKVETLTTARDDSSFTTTFWDLSKILSLIQTMKIEQADKLIKDVRLELMRLLVAESNASYSDRVQCYPYFVWFHILYEMDQVISILKCSPTEIEQKASDMISNWADREKVLLKSPKKWFDQVFDVRKNLLEILKMAFTQLSLHDLFNNSIGGCWLTLANEETKLGNLTRAENCIIQAEQNLQSCPNVVMSNAKLLFRKGEKQQALDILQAAIPVLFPDVTIWKEGYNNGVQNAKDRQRCCKAMLLVANWSHQLNLLDTRDNIKNYEECIKVWENSEKNHFALANYWDGVYVSIAETKNNTAVEKDIENEARYQSKIVKNYAQSLQYGCKYVYQSLPRLLTIWVDFAGIGFPEKSFTDHLKRKKTSSAPSFFTTVTSASSTSAAAAALTTAAVQQRPTNWLFTQQRMENSIREMVTSVPAYVLLTAMSQLISSINHPNSNCWALLKEVLCTILIRHPHQSLWMTMGIAKSNLESRKSRCMEIYNEAKTKEPQLVTMVRDYEMFGDKLMQVCKKTVKKEEETASLQSLCPGLSKLIAWSEFGNVLVPYNIFLDPTIPPNGRGHLNHNAFPEKFIFVRRVKDGVTIMKSAVMPKKVTLIGSNGKSFDILCKPKDDLRRDAKAMEVNKVMNWYLQRNQEAKQRQLFVKVYAVVPLNEKHGLLEWVPNLMGLLPCVRQVFDEKAIVLKREDLKFLNQPSESLEVTTARFQKFALDKYPVVLPEWFISNFSDPQLWYRARQSFTRTTAVMCIVGFILGLGDRHGQNVLIDSSTGNCVHVDYNFIFNLGELIPIPERVPFRLTRNIVKVFGPLGVEGPFRQACEITLSTIRENKEVLLSILRPFVFDPLLDLIGNKNLTVDGLTREEQANIDFMRIKTRIDGSGRNSSSKINTHLSIEAFVDHLITEATDIKNLCRMYYGWCSWL